MLPTSVSLRAAVCLTALLGSSLHPTAAQPPADPAGGTNGAAVLPENDSHHLGANPFSLRPMEGVCAAGIVAPTPIQYQVQLLYETLWPSTTAGDTLWCSVLRADVLICKVTW